MKGLIISIITCFVLVMNAVAQQRVVAECAVTYNLSVEEGAANKDMTESLRSSVKTVYIKGNNSRTDLVSPSYTQSLIYDRNSSSAVILREFGSNKFMTILDAAKWKEANKRYEGMIINYDATETRTILGYACKKAVIQLRDGSSFMLYYATNIVASVKEFEYQFKDIPGFVLEYEAKDEGNKKIKYTATKINLSPVQASRFDIPTSGYRLLN
ncbi:MAG: hypothetical protein NVSMB63_14360 [Sediminibacterium sp.]